MSDLFHTLRLLPVPGLGNQRIRFLIRRFGSARAVFEADPVALKQIGFIDEAILSELKQDNHRCFAEKQLADAEKQDVSIIPVWDSSYPELLKKIHDLNIVHSDLTTSNMIVCDGQVHFIDFGLSYTSYKIEDKAVDLHLLERALDSYHYNVSVMPHVLAAYDDAEVLDRLDQVERRGRYKMKREH